MIETAWDFLVFSAIGLGFVLIGVSISLGLINQRRMNMNDLHYEKCPRCGYKWSTRSTDQECPSCVRKEKRSVSK